MFYKHLYDEKNKLAFEVDIMPLNTYEFQMKVINFKVGVNEEEVVKELPKPSVADLDPEIAKIFGY